jgi:hypothetical protein
MAMSKCGEPIGETESQTGLAEACAVLNEERGNDPLRTAHVTTLCAPPGPHALRVGRARGRARSPDSAVADRRYSCLVKRRNDRHYYFDQFSYVRVNRALYAAILPKRVSPGLYLPGTARTEITRRFHALIVATPNVKSASSFSEKCRRVFSKTSSGT